MDVPSVGPHGQLRASAGPVQSSLEGLDPSFRSPDGFVWNLRRLATLFCVCGCVAIDGSETMMCGGLGP